ncbi:transposase [Streptomyces zagrosensis]|uniref:transposase n=1 Tax=Streptomyces zagrosensis TaxID=1042984 RepID=UPI0035E42984
MDLARTARPVPRPDRGPHPPDQSNDVNRHGHPHPGAPPLKRLSRWSGCSLTDAQWARIGPFLPDRTPKRGGRWQDHREAIDRVVYKFQTGT